MSNPYAPSSTPPPIEKLRPPRSSEEERRRAALRPKGLVWLVGGYGFFSLTCALVLLLGDELWWIAHLGFSVLIGWVLRSLWWGDDSSRKIGALFAAFVSLLFVLTWPEGGMSDWSAFDQAGAIEAPFMLCAAVYLTALRKHPFFAPDPRT